MTIPYNFADNQKIMKNIARKILPQKVLSMMRKAYYRLSLVRKIYYLPLEIKDLISGKGKSNRPPRSKILVGDGNFDQIGRDFLKYFIDIAKLKPHEKVLEAGCGIGRMAIPLTTYLSSTGSYEGFDLVADAIKWCQKQITPLFPNFIFQVADIQNDLYNPKGGFRASQYTFPYDDNHFDFVFLTSVLTHMLPPGLQHYIAEVSRVLKPGGRTLATFFLLNEESWRHVNSGKSQFNQEYEGCRVIDKKIPEAAIAYEETLVRESFLAHELDIVEPVLYGSWCPRVTFTSSQDIILATKKTTG